MRSWCWQHVKTLDPCRRGGSPALHDEVGKFVFLFAVHSESGLHQRPPQWHRTLSHNSTNVSLLLPCRPVRAHLSIIVDKRAPIEHVHGELKAEHGLLCQLAADVTIHISALYLVSLLILPPRKLLHPHLYMHSDKAQHIMHNAIPTMTEAAKSHYFLAQCLRMCMQPWACRILSVRVQYRAIHLLIGCLGGARKGEPAIPPMHGMSRDFLFRISHIRPP